MAAPNPPEPAPVPRERRPQGAAEARAEVEARRAERAAARRDALDAAFPGAAPGRGIRIASWSATAVVVALTAAAAADPDAVAAAFVAVSMTWFLAGSAVFALDIVLAAARSRTDAMGIGGLFFLAGAAPVAVQRSLNLSLAVAVVAVVVGAAVRPFTPLAFGVLSPVLQLGLSGLWGVRHGHFPPRPDLPGTGVPG